MSSGSSSSWWEEWSGTYHGWHDSSTPEPVPHEPASDDLVMKDRLQHTLVLSQRRSHKTFSERATSIFKGNAAYAAMEEIYHDAIKHTLEKTEDLEKTRQDRDHEGGLLEGDRG